MVVDESGSGISIQASGPPTGGQARRQSVFYHRNSWVGLASTFPDSKAALPIKVRFSRIESKRHPGRWEAVNVSRM